MIDKSRLKEILEEVRNGDTSVEDALGFFPEEENLEFARVDHDRKDRCGFPEVIFAESKTPEQSLAIAEALVNKTGFAFLTRVPDKTAKLLSSHWKQTEFNPLSRTMLIGKITAEPNPPKGKVLIVSAGTSDIPVAEEAAVTARVMGCSVTSLHDAGVAGIHRLLRARAELASASVIIVTAGMEGALPSVVAGLVSAPVIGVPTSVGYGAAFKGIAALLGMLSSCANGVAVVNIDNGFGAGCLAARILKSNGDNNEH